MITQLKPRPSLSRLCYTPAEVALLLGVGRTKVYELMASGQLGSISIGRSRRVTAEALDRFLAQQPGATT